MVYQRNADRRGPGLIKYAEIEVDFPLKVGFRVGVRALFISRAFSGGRRLTQKQLIARQSPKDKGPLQQPRRRTGGGEHKFA